MDELLAAIVGTIVIFWVAGKVCVVVERVLNWVLEDLPHKLRRHNPPKTVTIEQEGGTKALKSSGNTRG